MSRFRRLLDLLPHDTLMIGGRPYMRRWYLLGYAPPVANPHEEPGTTRPGWWWNGKLPIALRLHEILSSDDSRAFHDHPWPFVAIGLRGSYIEETPFIGIDGAVPEPGLPTNWTRRFRAPFVNVKKAEDLHVLEVDHGPVWTLFATARKRRPWGFAGPFGWLGWRDFDATYPERDAWTEAGS